MDMMLATILVLGLFLMALGQTKQEPAIGLIGLGATITPFFLWWFVL